jgi:survival-of-motor-neuron-related-splicing factor 30
MVVLTVILYGFVLQLFSKGSKGVTKKSIFASPEANTGKVGVGTCGVGGKPMTSYHQNEKWKKGSMN